MSSSTQTNDAHVPAPQSQMLETSNKATELVAPDPQATRESSPNKADNGSTSTHPRLQEPLRATTRSSREGSPVRPTEITAAGAPNNKLRKNSTDLSPSRIARITGSFAGIPSAAAVQRAMATQRPATLPATSEGAADAGKNDRVAKSGPSSPSWPISPRLRSPPPSLTGSRSAASIARKIDTEQTQPNTSLKRLAPVSTPELGALMETRETEDDSKSPSSDLRSPARGASTSNSLLETVAEGSAPTTPSIGPISDPLAESSENNSKTEASASAPATAIVLKDQPSKDGTTVGKDTKMDSEGKNKSEVKPSSATRPTATNLAKRSFTNLTGGKSRATEPTRTMTVETETVESIPQIIGGERGLSGRDGNGSVRTKPSSETIRPKREKKKFARKPPSLHSGIVTSKADIFEAKVASAVDEADTSDSDETFVYESNPPESRTSRNHSRTPSGASAGGQQNKLRNGSHNVSGKRSMKFTSNTYNNNLDGEHGPSDGTRGNSRTSTPRHHHIGRYGRPVHPSLFDQDSPFSQANKPNSPRASVGNLAKITRPNSPRVSNGKFSGSPRKGESYTYDIDDDAADDERTPLMGSVRVSRPRGHNRRPNSGNLRYMDYEVNDARGCFSGWGCCAVATVLLLLLCTGVGTFVVALNRALLDVSITGIQNVLASEQELMLDLEVSATNPNLFVISVTDLDVNLFAESAHVGTAESWRLKTPSVLSRGSRSYSSKGAIAVSSPWWWPDDGVDEGNDPIEDPEPGVQKMLLGRILEFDSPLVFESSPLMRTSSSSVGEIRLAKPGNKTEEGGSARWEHVLQHQFDLIVRGVIKYQLPISSKTRSAKIGGRIKVLPDTPVDDSPSNGTAPDTGSSISVIVGTVA